MIGLIREMMDSAARLVMPRIQWQGAEGSPNMFTAKGNKFLNRLEESGKGMHIGSTYIGAPTCADDIALLAQSAQDLQIMALLAWEESKTERFLYNKDQIHGI